MPGRYLHWARKLYELNRDVIGQRPLLKRPDDYANLPQIVHEQARCCFVLSTGRCGTALLTRLLKLSKETRCEHQPSPELVHFSRLAYESPREDSYKFKMGIDMARYELIENAFLRDQIYVETNNRITFFAPFLAEVFKRATFIHLVRHPGDFVRSGIRREWYSGKGYHDAGRIVPTDSSPESWDKMTQIEKIAWLWNETNQFIEDFKMSLEGPDLIMLVKAEDLFSTPEMAAKIFRFLQLEPPPVDRINKVIRHPVNVQRAGDFPGYDRWDPERKKQLEKYAVLFSKYGYDL